MNHKLQQALVRLLGRKFLIVAGMLASTHWLMNYSRIDANTYMYVILGTVAVYITGNVTQNIKLSSSSQSESLQIKNTVGDVSSTTTVSVPSDDIASIVEQIKSIPVQLKL